MKSWMLLILRCKSRTRENSALRSASRSTSTACPENVNTVRCNNFSRLSRVVAATGERAVVPALALVLRHAQEFPCRMAAFAADKKRYQTMIQCPDGDRSKKGGIDAVCCSWCRCRNLFQRFSSPLSHYHSLTARRAAAGLDQHTGGACDHQLVFRPDCRIRRGITRLIQFTC